MWKEHLLYCIGATAYAWNKQAKKLERNHPDEQDEITIERHQAKQLRILRKYIKELPTDHKLFTAMQRAWQTTTNYFVPFVELLETYGADEWVPINENPKEFVVKLTSLFTQIFDDWHHRRVRNKTNVISLEPSVRNTMNKRKASKRKKAAVLNMTDFRKPIVKVWAKVFVSDDELQDEFITHVFEVDEPTDVVLLVGGTELDVIEVTPFGRVSNSPAIKKR